MNRQQLESFRLISAEKRINDKILEKDEVGARTIFWKKKWDVVLATGVFDILHVGHIRLLRAASCKGDILVVGINSDASVRKLKGSSRPIVPQQERAEMLASFSMVDYVTIFEGDTPVNLIKTVQPKWFVKGGDYLEEELIEKPFVEKYQGRVVILPFERDHSTTGLLERISGMEV